MSQEDLETLRSGLEDEADFRLAELVGAEVLERMLKDAQLDIDACTSERFFAFGKAIAILSVYLPEYVSGVEVVEELDAGLHRMRVECWRYVGRQGELIAVPLQFAVSLQRDILPGREDLAALRRLWPELPQWARNAYKLTFDELADLSSGG
ncbi:MAG: hypothetical protein ACOZIN_11475 [Myxococcota bacterium]